MSNNPHIVEQTPRREWLLRCQTDDDDIAVCAIGVCSGTVEVYGPQENQFFSLGPWQTATFRRALDEAITVAETDLANHYARP